MNNHLSSFESSFAGGAIEYGTLTLFIESLMYQPVLVMPLERSIHSGSMTLFQWVIHVTTRIDMKSPIAYATFRAADVKRTALAETMVFPTQEERVVHSRQRAQHLQQHLQGCVIDLLNRSGYVSQVTVPARYRLPDEWVWSAHSTDERIVCRDGAWVLIER